jgi:hypothetical protein
MAHLSDDGTMDTVIVCDRCGAEHRFNYEPPYLNEDVGEEYHEAAHDAFIDECIAEVDENCDCVEPNEW